MANISGTERIQWTIEGQRFEQVTGFVVHESKFFESWFENYDGSSYESEGGKTFDIAPELVGELNENSHNSGANNEGMQYVVRTETDAATGGKKSFFFDLRKIPKLEAEWMGAIMVYLRRGRTTFKWDEMEYEQQQSFSRLVVFFGINKMMERHGKPSKPRPSSTSTAGGGTTSASQAMAGLLPEGADQASRLAMAQVTLENYRESSSQQQAEDDNEDGLTVDSTTTTGGADSVRKGEDGSSTAESGPAFPPPPQPHTPTFISNQTLNDDLVEYTEPTFEEWNVKVPPPLPPHERQIIAPLVDSYEGLPAIWRIYVAATADLSQHFDPPPKKFLGGPNFGPAKKLVKEIDDGLSEQQKQFFVHMVAPEKPQNFNCE